MANGLAATRRFIDVIHSAGGDAVLRRRLQSGLLWNIIAAVFNQGSTFALGLVVANVLGRETFGMYGLLQSTLLLLSNFTQFAMGYTTTKYVAELRASDQRRTARIVAASLTGATVAAIGASLFGWAVASFAADRIIGQPALAPFIRISAPTIAFIVLSGIATGALAGFESFRRIAVNGIVSGIVYIGLGAWGAMRWGLTGVAVSLVVSSAVQAIMLVIQAVDEARRHGAALSVSAFREMLEEAPMLIHFAIPAALAGFSAAPTLWIVNAVLARQARGLTAVALFTAANSIRLAIMFVPYLVNRVGFSLLNNYRGVNDAGGFRRAFWANTAVVTAMTVIGLTGVAIGSPFIMRIFGPAFIEGRGTLIILAAATLPEAVAIGFFQIVQARGLMWIALFRVTLPRDVTIVLAALLFAPRYGAAGGALAFLVGATVMLLSNLLLLRRLGISAR